MIKNMSPITKIGLLVILFTGGLAYAQNVPPIPKVNQVRQEVRNEVRQKVDQAVGATNTIREERRVQVEQKLQEIKNKYREQRQTRIAAYVEKMIARFNAAVERLEKLAVRIDSHLTNLETKKVNVTEARALLITANTKIQEAKNSIALIRPTADSALQSDDIKMAFESARQIIDNAKTALKSVHAALVDVINSIKPGLNKTATTTPS